jgi:hypothetical protein
MADQETRVRLTAEDMTARAIKGASDNLRCFHPEREFRHEEPARRSGRRPKAVWVLEALYPTTP